MDEFDDAAEQGGDDWFPTDPYRLVKRTGPESFRAAVDTVRSRQLDVAGQARAELASRGIDLDGLMAEFAEACLIPGVDGELAEASETSSRYKRLGFAAVGPAVRLSSAFIRPREVALGINQKRPKVEFGLLDSTMDEDGAWQPSYPTPIHDLDDFFDKLSFIAGDVQARTMVAKAERLEAMEEAGADETALGAAGDFGRARR